LSDRQRELHTLPTDLQIDLRRQMLIPRELGTLRSGRVIARGLPYEEALVVYVLWDGLRTPEAWDLTDLVAIIEEKAKI